METTLETLDPVVLAQRVQALQRDQQELERKRYTDACIARFSQLMRYQDNLPLDQWAQQLMDAFAVEFETLQSALYRMHESGQLVYTGGFATHTNAERNIMLGEGLVGQTAQSRRPLYLTHETGIDTHTHSSLARLQLRGLAIVPLVFNERLEGVLEMATLDPFSPEKRELLEALAQVLAANLGTIANQFKLRQLLQEAQDKSNALISQEEELRQNLEELEATQDEMRRVQQELQANSARLQQLALVAEKTDNAVIITDARGDIQWVNPGFTNICGWSLDEVKGKKPGSFLQGPETDQATVQRIRENLRAGVSFREEILNYHRNGKPYWVSMNITPIKDANGIVQQFLAFELDITQQKHQQMELARTFEQVQSSEEELRQNAEELQAQHEEMRRVQIELAGQISALNNAAIVSEADVRGDIIFCNDEFVRLAKYSREELLGNNHRIVKSGHQPQEIFVELWATISKGRVWRGELKNRAKDGSYYWVAATITPVLGLDNKPVKYIGVRFDITAQMQQREELAAAFEQVQASEEEIRQNAEELIATQEQLARMARESQNQLDAINRSTAMVELDMDGKLVFANPQFLRISGYTLDQLEGQPHYSLVPPAIVESPQYRAFWAGLRRGEFQEGEFERIRPDGTSFWIRGSYNPILGEDGTPVKIVKFCVDITAQKQQQAELSHAFEELQASEEEIRQNAEELQAAQEQLARMARDSQSQLDAINRSTAMVELDMDGNVLYANNQFQRISGYTLGQLQGQPHKSLVPPAFADSQEYKAFWAALRRGEYQEGEFERLRPNGTSFWIRGSYNPILGEDGKPIKVLKFCVDVTEQKEQQATLAHAFEELQASEEEIRQNAEELQATQEELTRLTRDMRAQLHAIRRSTATVEIDLNGIIMDANENFLLVVGYRLDEVKNKHHRMFVDDAYAKSSEYADFWRKLNFGEYVSGEFPRRTKDGRTIWIQGSYNPVFGADGKPERIIKYCYDITHVKQQQAQLQNAFEELQASEEEVRQSAEELNAQHEEMRRVQMELNGQVNALNNAAIVSEADVRGDIIFVNEEFLRLAKYSREELLGNNHRIVKSGHQPQEIFVDLWATISKGKVWRGELKNRAKDGSYYWVAATITPVLGQDGKPIKYIGVRFDITALKVAEERLLTIGESEEPESASIDPAKAIPDQTLGKSLRQAAANSGNGRSKATR